MVPLSELVAQVSQKLADNRKDDIRLKKYQYRRKKGILHLEYEVMKGPGKTTKSDNSPDLSEKQDDVPPELAYRKRYSQY